MKHVIPALLMLFLLVACPPRRGGDDDDTSGGSTLIDGAFLLNEVYAGQGYSYAQGALWLPREEEDVGCDELLADGYPSYYDSDYDFLWAMLFLGSDLDGWEQSFQNIYSGDCGVDLDDESTVSQAHCLSGYNYSGADNYDELMSTVITISAYSDSIVRGTVQSDVTGTENFRVEHCGTYDPYNEVEPDEPPPPGEDEDDEEREVQGEGASGSRVVAPLPRGSSRIERWKLRFR